MRRTCSVRRQEGEVIRQVELDDQEKIRQVSQYCRSQLTEVLYWYEAWLKETRTKGEAERGIFVFKGVQGKKEPAKET